MPEAASATEAAAHRASVLARPLDRSRRAAPRLARIGTSKQVGNPVLEPLFRTVRANHPKADLALIERAYDDRRAAPPRPDAARAATPTSPTRSP